MWNIQEYHERYLAAFADGRYADLPVSCTFPVGIDFHRLHARKIDKKYEGNFSDLFTTDYESKIGPELTSLSQHLLGGMHAAGRNVRDGFFVFEFFRGFVIPAQPVSWHIDCIAMYSAEDYVREQSRKFLHEGAQIFQTVVSDKFPTAVAPEDTFAGRPEGFDHALYVLAALNTVIGRDVFIPWNEVAKEIGGNFDARRLAPLIETMKLKGENIVRERYAVAKPIPGLSQATHFSYLAPHAPTQHRTLTWDSPLPGLPLHNQVLLRSFPSEPK